MGKISITWKDDNYKSLLAEEGVSSFVSLMNIEQFSEKLHLLRMREHNDKNTGKVIRQMTQFKINDQIFYIKRAYGISLDNIINEYNAIKLMPKFGIKASKVIGYCFDKEESKGFLLLKNLDGYYSLKDIILQIAPQEFYYDFVARKDEILSDIAMKINGIHKEGYIYPDWFAKHIYIKPNCDQFVLIDLERFCKISDCPWYYRFSIFSYFVKKKIFKKLRVSLKRESDLLTDDDLKILSVRHRGLSLL